MPSSKPSHAATIRPRPRRDGTTAWDVRYRIDGASQTMGFDDNASAERWMKIVKAIGAPEAVELLKNNSSSTTPTVAEYAETYISTKSGVEPRTKETYRDYMRLHLADTFGPIPIDAVTPAAVAAWINKKAAAGYASKTIKNWHGFLAGMFEEAVFERLVPASPCARSRLPETERVEMTFLSPDEFTSLLSYVPSKSQALVLLLATTGLRWSEATALRAGDFDLTTRTVRVARAWKKSKVKGYYIGPPKTPKSRRTVSIPEDLIPILESLISAGYEYVFTNQFHKPVRQQNFHGAVWGPARRLANGLPAFNKAKADPEQDWLPRKNGIWFERLPAAAPIGKMPRVHDLRHSHASWLLASGVSIDVVSRRLGHESISTTVNIYGHIAEERLHKAGDVIGLVLAGAMPQLER